MTTGSIFIGRAPVADRAPGRSVRALKRCLIGGLLPAGLLLSACADQSSQTTRTFTSDVSGVESANYSEGYAALNSGNNRTARQDLAQSYAARPSDPFEEVNYAASLQNSGQIDQAIPLYRDAIARGGNVYGNQYTRPEVQGMSVADVARWNLAQAGRDAAGNRLSQMSQTTQVTQTTRTAAQVTPAANTFQVFFPFNRADITPESAAIIRQAAQSAAAGHSIRITVTGHTDTAGTSAYNQRLSERRAQAVERMLVADGMPRGVTVERGVGETDLLVPTADGVREHQNRRVVIVEEVTRVN